MKIFIHTPKRLIEINPGETMTEDVGFADTTLRFSRKGLFGCNKTDGDLHIDIVPNEVLKAHLKGAKVR